MGWLAFPVIGLVAMAAMALLGIGRRYWQLAGAALMLGAAGYVLQGSPMLAGAPARGTAPAAGIADPALVELRGAMMGRFTSDDAYLLAADALARSGDTRDAAGLLASGTRAHPNSILLWTALGTALAAHDGDTVSPPAAFAFERAERLAPAHPGPPFFAGMAAVRAGDLAGAQGLWRRALSLAPPNAGYRSAIAERLALLDRAVAATR